MENNIQYSKEVLIALEKNLPIVALESTIISHGMPYPQNIQMALMAENEIRSNGCIPATIAIIKGQIKVGLEKNEIEYLAQDSTNVIKTSRRDIPYIITKKANGATTVSGTMFIASLANIKVFVTGGIGGVHRGVEQTWDISSDLEELQSTNVAVVCAGIKSILDIPKTLEYLETKAVPVIGYRTKTMPAFYTSKSDSLVNYQIDDPKDIADLIKTKWLLGLNGGVVIANPIPLEYELDNQLMQTAIQESLKKANQANITGKAITPYLLEQMVRITKGKSLDANIQLVRNNCQLATQIAKHLYGNS